MSHFTDTLNPAQKEAVLNYDKPSLIVAGAGSGKTRVLTSRIAYMIEQGVHPGSILALTFTNKAAREMRERIEQLVPDGRARYIWMGTFHSVFYRILRQEAGRLGFDANFTIYDTANSESLLSTIIKERNLNTDEYKPRDIHSRISLAKNNLVTAEAYAANTSFVAEDRQRKRPEFSAIFLEYARRCKANNAMDFDDLLIYANILFRDFPDALEQYRNRFRYILVDEYQDTNYAQYLIVRRLAQTHSNVCVVGDDAQSIYSFRGAKIENILRFQNDFPEAKVFKLEQNYRSTQNIVNAANSIIAKNDRQIPKHVFSENDEGDRVKVLKAYTDQEEAYLVADLAKREGRENGGRWNEIAVLYRNNSQSRAIEDALRRRDVPYRIYSGHSFYDRKEIKDLVAYFRLIVNPRDNEALRRIINTPARGIGAVTVARVAAVAAERGVSMWEVLEGTGSEQVPELKTAAKKLADFTGLIRSLSLERSTKPLHEFGLEVATRSGLIGSYRMNPSPESENALLHAELQGGAHRTRLRGGRRGSGRRTHRGRVAAEHLPDDRHGQGGGGLQEPRSADDRPLGQGAGVRYGIHRRRRGEPLPQPDECHLAGETRRGAPPLLRGGHTGAEESFRIVRPTAVQMGQYRILLAEPFHHGDGRTVRGPSRRYGRGVRGEQSRFLAEAAPGKIPARTTRIRKPRGFGHRRFRTPGAAGLPGSPHAAHRRRTARHAQHEEYGQPTTGPGGRNDAETYRLSLPLCCRNAGGTRQVRPRRDYEYRRIGVGHENYGYL